MRAWAGLAIVGLLVACGPSERACTQIAAIPGVGVTVAADLAPQLRDLRLRVCLDECRDVAVALDPGSRAVPQGCDGDQPDDACSATSEPDGTLVGFVELEGLATGTAQVSATATVDGATRTWPATDVPIGLVYPNGPDCPPDGPQGQVTLAASGLAAG